MRWELDEDKKRFRNRKALIEVFAQVLEIDEDDLSYQEALKTGLLAPLFLTAKEGKNIAAMKLALQMVGEMPEGADAKVIVDKRQVHITNTISFDSPNAAQAYIEDQRSQGNFKQAAEVEEVLAGELIEGDVIEVEITFDED